MEITQGHPVVALYALGHIYSIVGFHSHRDSAINVVVIATHTGETIWKYVKPVRYFEQGSCGIRYEPELQYLATIRDEWLSDIHTACPPLIPFMAYENLGEAMKGNLAVDGLSFSNTK